MNLLLVGAVAAVGGALVVRALKRRQTNAGGSGSGGAYQPAASAGTTLGYKNGEPYEIEVVEVAPGRLLERRAAEAFIAMRNAAQADGIMLSLNSAFRDHAKQTQLYNEYLAGTGPLAARPGYSIHESGGAIDVGGTVGGTSPTYHWLARNAQNYGFCRTVSSESWHMDYNRPGSCVSW